MRKSEGKKTDNEALDDTPSLRSQFSRMVRETIILKAMERFREDGYRATSVKAIAKAANTTHTTFYKFFDSKFQLLLEASAVVRPEIDEIVERLRVINSADVVSLREWVGEYTELWRHRQAIFEAVWVAVHSEPAFAHRVSDETMHMASVYRAGLQNADSAMNHPLTRELALVMMTTHPMFASAMRAPDKSEQDAMLDAITSILSRSLSRPGGWDQSFAEADSDQST